MRSRTFLILIAILLCFGCKTTVSAVNVTSEDDYSTFTMDEPVSLEETQQTDSYETNSLGPITITVYENEYVMGTTKYYGAWRDGTSGGSNTADVEIYLNHAYDETYDISFCATVTGEYSWGNSGTIGAELNVTLGVSKSYSLGSGITVTVPKDFHYLIQYRPTYKICKVIETSYLETYQNGYLLSRHYVDTKTCYVDVFCYWDYTVVED